MASATLLKLIRTQGGDATNWFESADPRVQLLRQLFRGKASGEGHHGAKMMKEMISFLKDGDLDDDGVMSFPEFKTIISKLQREVSLPTGLTGPDLGVLYAMLDPMHCGYVLFEDLFCAVLGPITTDRLKLVECAYQKLDSDNDGCIDAAELVDFYKKNGGSKSSGAKFNERKMYDIINSFGIADTGKLNKVEFFNYYRNMSFFTDSDIIFENEICDTWCITFSELVSAVKKAKKSVSMLLRKSNKELETGFHQQPNDAGVKKLYDLFFRGGIKEGLKELLTWVSKIDLDNNGIMSQAEFKTLLKKKTRHDKIADDEKLTGPEMDKLYWMLDPSKAGNVHFQEFYEAMRVLSDPSLALTSQTSMRGVTAQDIPPPSNVSSKSDLKKLSSSPVKPSSESPSPRKASSSVFGDPSRGGKVKKALLARLKAEGAEGTDDAATPAAHPANSPPLMSPNGSMRGGDAQEKNKPNVKLFADPTRGKQIRQALLNELKKQGSATINIHSDEQQQQQQQQQQHQKTQIAGEKSTSTSASTIVVEGPDKELVVALKKTIESQELTIASQQQTIAMLQKLLEKSTS